MTRCPDGFEPYDVPIPEGKIWNIVILPGPGEIGNLETIHQDKKTRSIEEEFTWVVDKKAVWFPLENLLIGLP